MNQFLLSMFGCRLSAGGWVLAAVMTLAVVPGWGAPEAEAEGDSQTQIQADKVDVDFKAGKAVFEGSVSVSDVRISLRSNKMIVFFTEQNKLKRIEAVGDVVIVQADSDREARAGRAEYEVDSGQITLMDKPRLRDGSNEMSGADRVIYFRDSEKVITEGGRPTIQFVVPKESATKMDVFGKDRTNGEN